jgi:hypothetical protein
MATTQIHPLAVEVAGNLGMEQGEVERIVLLLAGRNPAALIGGYNIDVMIAAAAATLALEDHVTLWEDGQTGRDRADYKNDIIARLQAMIEVYCEGGI